MNLISDNVDIVVLNDVAIDMHQGINTVTEKVEYRSSGIPIIQSKHITKGYLKLTDARFLNEDAYLKYKDKYQPKEDDILVCNIGTIGSSIRIKKADRFLIAWNLFLIKLDKSRLSSEYFSHYLNYLSDKKYFDRFLTGGTVKFINKKTMGNIPIPLPPLETQQKIAAILDKAQALIDNDKLILAKYDQLAQSVFFDMFGDPGKNVNNYPISDVSSIANKVTDGEHTTPKRSQSGYRLLSARNVKNGFIDLNAAVDYVDTEEFTRIYKRCNPEIGDILISCSGTIGRVTVNKLKEPFVLVRSVALIKPKRDLINSEYFGFLLRTKYMQMVMKRSSNTSSQANLFTGPIKKLPVLMPPKDLQNHFADTIKQIERQKQLTQQSLKKSEELFQSLLQRAFKGELV